MEKDRKEEEIREGGERGGRRKERQRERRRERRKSASFSADHPYPSTPETDSRPVILNFLIAATL